MNVIAAEMEASVIFVLARAWGLQAGGISVVVDHIFDAQDQKEGFDPEALFSHGDDNIEKLAKAGSEAVYLLQSAR